MKMPSSGNANSTRNSMPQKPQTLFDKIRDGKIDFTTNPHTVMTWQEHIHSDEKVLLGKPIIKGKDARIKLARLYPTI